MKTSQKPRVFLALYHRGKLSLLPYRDELGLASLHWALLITPKNAAEATYILDVTDAMQIDPVRHIDTNTDRNWISRVKVENPFSDIRLVLIAMIGKLKTRSNGLEQLVEVLKQQCRVPQKDTNGENCAWWVKQAVHFLQSSAVLNEFDVDGTFREAQRLAIDRIDGRDIARERTEVVNFTSRICDVQFGMISSNGIILHTTSNSTSQATIVIVIFIIANMLNSIVSASGRAPWHIRKVAETHSGTTTSWLPLITSPPPDPRCSGHFYNPDAEYHTLIAFDPRLETTANMTCLPREVAEWYMQKNLPYGATTGTVTSLGPMNCPDGYTTASTSKKDATSTMIFCCPSNYAFATSANHSDLYGCTSMQTQLVTVHFASATASVGILAAGLPSRAPNVAGIAVNGWIFRPSPTFNSTSPDPTFFSATPTQTTNGDIWAKKHIGMTTAEFSGILIGGFAGLLLILVVIHYSIQRKCFRGRKPKADEEGGGRKPTEGTRDSSLSSDRVDLNPTRDVVEMDDLDSSGTRVSSEAETVVRYGEGLKSEVESVGELGEEEVEVRRTA